MSSAPQLSVVVPIHDEAESLPLLYRELTEVLKDAGGARVATYPMGVDLRGVLPGSRAVTRSFPAPDVAPGTYTVALEVLDPSGYLAPMALASGSRAADGASVLGRVAVRASTSTWR